jgi:hypothetical protein
VEPYEAVAEKYPLLNGEYVMTDRWYCGRPVYKNQFGQLLYQHDDTTNTGWAIGPNIGEPNIRGLKARKCPADETSWTFFNGISSWPFAKIDIRCNKICRENQEVPDEWCLVEDEPAKEDLSDDVHHLTNTSVARKTSRLYQVMIVKEFYSYI